MKTIVIASMYANPVHPGHIECLELAKQLGDELIVIVNNDLQQKLKIGTIFQDEQFRLKVIASLKPVDRVFLSIDTDGGVCESIETIFTNEKMAYGEEIQFIFAKGGDRFVSNIPEVKICQHLGIKIVDGLGGKTHNSSDIRNRKVN